MKGNWWGTIGAGIAIACLAIPLTALGATKAELLEKSQQHRALTSGKASPKAAKAANKQSAKEQKTALRAKKAALIKERAALAKQGDVAALDANRTKLAAVTGELKIAKKGGAKK